MEIQILNYSRGPLDFNIDKFNSISDWTKLDIDARSQLRYSRNSPYVGIQFDFTVLDGENLILKGGFLFALRIEGWEQILSDAGNLEEHREIVADILRFIWPGVVGVVAARTAEIGGRPFMLPPIDEDEYARQVMLVCSPS